MKHPMLTKRDLYRLDGYNDILAACLAAPLNFTDLNAILPHISTATIRNHCKFLLDEGYLSMEQHHAGSFRRISNFYTSVKKEYLIDDLVPTSVRINTTMKRNGTSTKGDGLKNTYDAPVETNKPHLRVISFDNASAESINLREKLTAQCKLNRLEMKSPRNCVSGSTLSAAV